MRAQDAALRALAEKASVEATRYLDDLANACTPGAILALLDRCERAERECSRLTTNIDNARSAIESWAHVAADADNERDAALARADKAEARVAEEREACAKVADRYEADARRDRQDYGWCANEIAAAIRARAEQGET